MQDPLSLYMDRALQGRESMVSSGMGPTIPSCMDDAISLATSNLANAGQVLDESIRERIAKIFKETTRQFDAYTETARASLDAFLHGEPGIEVAHQPKFMGGEKFVYNKIALGHAMATLGTSRGARRFFPFFYLADYDKVHPELVKSHFSLSNSSTGFVLSIDPEVERRFDGASIHALPVPDEVTLRDLLDTIRERYTFSIASSVDDGARRALLEERLDEALRLLVLASRRATSHGSWFLHLVATITNVFHDHGYLLVTSSDPVFRDILLPHYETIVRDRDRYIALYKSLLERFTSHGLEPPLRAIDDEFVPFFLECTGRTCASRRIRLRATNEGSRVVLRGKCDACGQQVEMDTSRSSPDLSDHARHLCPRVESRQYLVSKAIAPAIHVSGTGEARYYTMSIPLLRAFDPATYLPVIHFYNKLTTNSFITRRLEARLVEAGVPGFLDAIKELMRHVGKFNALIKKPVASNKDIEAARVKAVSILANVKDAASGLEHTCNTAATTTPPDVAVWLKAYAGNLFGTIAKERHGQEPAFNWIDIALHDGIGAFFSGHQRLYQPWLPPGMEAFF